jgi:molybdate transport system regulatory protein
MKISARNAFAGKVGDVHLGAVNAEVTVEIAGGGRITAIVTKDSTESLGLAPGRAVTAIVKASSVLVMVDASGMRLSARNQLAGTVQQVIEGAVDAEVAILLPGGAVVHAVITKESVHTLGLKPGVAATAVIKSSSVILGVAP